MENMIATFQKGFLDLPGCAVSVSLTLSQDALELLTEVPEGSDPFGSTPCPLGNLLVKTIHLLDRATTAVLQGQVDALEGRLSDVLHPDK